MPRKPVPTKPVVPDPRYLHVDTCAECKSCGGSACDGVRRVGMRHYFTGIRFTADGFDCALPVAIDSHSHCSYQCCYCFSDSLEGHLYSKSTKGVGQLDLRLIERIFSGGVGKRGRLIRQALKFDRRNAGGYSCPIQLGGVNDPCDNIERQQGWLLNFIDLAIRFQVPVRISTKGNLLREPDYLRALGKAPHLFWVAFSIITPDDELIERIDRGAPNATERIKTMEALSEIGVSTSLRLRPVIPGATDRTRNHPQAYRLLIDKVAQAGARAVSYECIFYPSRGGPRVHEKFDQISRATGVPLRRVFDLIGSNETCRRPSTAWTENIMHAIRDEAHAQGLVVGVSDPMWKQLTDTGCCCGMMPDDPVFGNWERENATEALRRGRDGEAEVLWPEDVVPPWAEEVVMGDMVAFTAGPLTVWKKRHTSWADNLRYIWNNLKGERGPLNYFQGALWPAERRGDGAVGYRYVGLERANLEKVPFWDLSPGVAAEPQTALKVRECNFADTCDGSRCKRCLVKR